MKRSIAILLIILALLLGFGSAMGYYLLERKRFKQEITQMQNSKLHQANQLHEFRTVTDLNAEGQKETLFYVKIEQTLPIHLQLSLMADALSRHCFSFLPIEVQDVREYDGKMLALINLKEFEGFKIGNEWTGASWAYGFFQGSAGGASTSAILIESFLQRDNPLPWIDGLVFLYEEQALRQFEHVAVLGQTIFKEAK